MNVEKNKVVSIDYTLTDDQGVVLDSSDKHGPLAYLHGVGQLIPGLESALEGKSAGDTLTVTIPPKDAYGERDESLMFVIPKEHFRGIDDIEVGMQFETEGGSDAHVVTVVDVTDDKITVDGNHPLAGVTLNFDVTVVDVRDATAEELEHGHVHDAGEHAQ